MKEDEIAKRMKISVGTFTMTPEYLTPYSEFSLAI